MHFVYILVNAEKQLYIGETSDLNRRLKQHNQHEGKNRWTKGKGPWTLLHCEEFPDRTLARKREIYLKSGWGRTWIKRHLLNSNLP
jgi:putative endonuclease